jgi:hypothetical protein
VNEPFTVEVAIEAEAPSGDVEAVEAPRFRIRLLGLGPRPEAVVGTIAQTGLAPTLAREAELLGDLPAHALWARPLENG